MRKSKFSETQIITILKAVEAGKTVRDVCREHEISDATYYKWKTEYGGMEAADIRRLRELEEENRRLKHMYAELSLEHRILKEVLEKSCKARGQTAVDCGLAPGTQTKRKTGL
jgi:putative transposase